MNTLPEESSARKEIPLYEGLLKYFPAALAGVAGHSKRGNDKHNPGEPLHHARGRSTDHADCIMRHLVDLADMLASMERKGFNALGRAQVLTEADALCWRALALSQELYEKHGGAPLAPNAREPETGATKLLKEIDKALDKMRVSETAAAGHFGEPPAAGGATHFDGKPPWHKDYCDCRFCKGARDASA